MWILTILLLFYGGEVKAYSVPINGYMKAECQATADDVWKLNSMGFHVIAATCERVKEA